MLFYQIPAPNEALVISGGRKGSDGGQFRIVTGQGAFVFPWRSRARKLSLDLREANLQEQCVTKLAIPLGVDAVAVFKVGDDPASISNAARRFLDQQQGMETLVGQVLAGHLRSIVGGLTPEEIIGDRNRLAQEVKSASSEEMEKLGLVVDAFQIQEVSDPSGYIKNLAAPHAAAVEREARIAQAKAGQLAAQAEQEAAAATASYERDTEIKRAGYQAEVERAQAEAAQAGPLAQAKATQQVTEEQTRLAELRAAQREQELVAEVEKPADAEAYRTKTIAEAERDALKARAEGLGDGNQALIAANAMVQQLPDLVAAAATGLNGANVVIVNGTEGFGEFLSTLATQGYSIYEAVKQGLPGAAGVTSGAPRAAVGAAVGAAGAAPADALAKSTNGSVAAPDEQVASADPAP